MAQTHGFSKGEEIANAVTHGIGAVMSLIALVFLIIASAMDHNAWYAISILLFGFSMFLVYLSSTLVHALPKGKAKDIFEIFDHASIYFFIAGTFTPISIFVIRGRLGWVLLGIVWVLAVGGIVFKAFLTKKFMITSTLLYVLMGWLVVIGWPEITTHLSHNGISLLFIGGICYTVGAVFYVWRGFPYHHAVWHLFVIAGTVLQYFSILLYISPFTS